MSEPNVFQFDNPRHFLVETTCYYQKENPGSSIRKLSRKMGFKSHSLLIFLLQGKRPLRVKHAMPLAKGFGLGAQETLYLQGLIQLEAAADEEEANFYRTVLADLRPENTELRTIVNHYEIMAHWVHTAILALHDLPNFNTSPESIYAKLNKRVPLNEIRASIVRLIELGLLVEAESGQTTKTTENLESLNDVPSKAIENYHGDMCDIAKKTLSEIDVLRREFQSLSIPIDLKQVSLAKKLLRKFRNDFVEEMTKSVSKDAVYQLNLQFFPLTNNSSEILSSDAIDGAGTD